MLKKSKGIILMKRLLIWSLYFSGFILYSKKGDLYPLLITFQELFIHYLFFGSK